MLSKRHRETMNKKGVVNRCAAELNKYSQILQHFAKYGNQ